MGHWYENINGCFPQSGAFLDNNNVLPKPTALSPYYLYFKTLKLKKEKYILLPFLKGKPEQILLKQRYQVSQSARVGTEQNRAFSVRQQ